MKMSLGAVVSGRRRRLACSGTGALGVEDVRAWMADLAERATSGDIAVKSVNNALGTLVVCLNGAPEDGLIVANPALRLPRLPAAHIEREYLRLHE
jgi:hypothetical protein